MGHCEETVLGVVSPGGGPASAAVVSTPQSAQDAHHMFGANSRAESVANSIISAGEMQFRKDLRNGKKKRNGTGMLESTLNETRDRMPETAVRELQSIELDALDGLELCFDNDEEMAQANKFCEAFLRG